MQASNRDEWASQLKKEWMKELNAAKGKAPADEMCKEKFRSQRSIRIYDVLVKR